MSRNAISLLCFNSLPSPPLHLTSVVVRLGCVDCQQTLILVPGPARGTLGPGEVLGRVTGRSPGEGDVIRGELAGVAWLGDDSSPQD